MAKTLSSASERPLAHMTSCFVVEVDFSSFPSQCFACFPPLDHLDDSLHLEVRHPEPCGSRRERTAQEERIGRPAKDRGSAHQLLSHGARQGVGAYIMSKTFEQHTIRLRKYRLARRVSKLPFTPPTLSSLHLVNTGKKKKCSNRPCRPQTATLPRICDLLWRW